MNCPVCDRSLAPTLSICPSCGAMMFDSVREELQGKITSGRLANKVIAVEPAMPVLKIKSTEPIAAAAAAPTPANTMVNERKIAAPTSTPAAAPLAKPSRRVETTDLNSPKTSPTLVGFQSKNPSLPDWRLQLQNAVQQRKGGKPDAGVAIAAAAAPVRTVIAQREMALPADVAPVEAKIPESADPRVANAMRRIAESRQNFLEKEKKTIPAAKPSPKVHRFDLLSTPMPRPAVAAAAAPIKPRLVPNPVDALAVTAKRDTNKLPPILLDRTHITHDAEVAQFDEEISKPLPAEFDGIKRIRITAEHLEGEEVDIVEADSEEIEDLAHVSMRFGAGLFDLIITSFISLLLLSPVLFTRDGWFSPAGLLAFAGVNAVIMFCYMTVCLGFYGKTIGMRLFSLELVDAVENEYPTLHQAAVNSSVFILSLIFGGLGFLTMLFNEEKRAAHDLLSGTILVREF